ncbi:TATA box-binding protein-associated factor [Heterostelium album PN500]|uniref:B-related factor 1 n=1 Tax=Heterostelium pallidum (strain ATCC 26659 / Pp 5 / PN500) TaxID=670386 RepID=D3AW31_HETP5|nr:TATA box-binding protein-associated factor [Heterostelium album PN500]EFA86504.1 TATA box-binding protein-associated factor [Heterostelium album PN500]|eukprot:XP_020438609.1 TATA box-binding protein-associated factor [Heterostelium album PN500]
MSKKVCPDCGGTSFDSSNDGSTVCVACGKVIDSANIVSEIQFSDSSGVMGTFVSKSGGGSRSYRNLGRDSRELSIENARRRLHMIASQVNLKQHHIDMALRMYQLAIEHNFTKGRRTQNVAATCLYIVCRRESTPRIFANSLEFEEKTQEVAATALKLVARMKRDWMATGRRPSGICGASLFIAAKMHGFTRTVREIIQIVKIGETTLTKRLDEFKQTPASMMRISEFEAVEIEGECDPPSFTRNREKDAKQARKEELLKLKREKLVKELKEIGGKSEEKDEEEEEEKSEESEKKAEDGEKKIEDGEKKTEEGESKVKTEAASETPAKKKRKTKAEKAKQEQIDKEKEEDQKTEDEINEILMDQKCRTKDELELLPSTLAFSLKSRLDFSAPLPPLTTKIVEYPRINDEVDPSVFEPTATLDDLSDEELDTYIEDDKETIYAKDVIWSEMNKEWIVKQAQREKEIAEAEAAGVPVRRKKTKKSATSSEEALQESIRNKAKQERIMNLFKNLIHTGENVKQEILSPSGVGSTPGAGKRSRLSTAAAEDEPDEEEEEEERPATSLSHSLLSQQQYDNDYDDDEY